MRLELQELRLINIRTYKDATFQFQKGTTVIIGENGAGKSTILDSILFSLYNTTKTGITNVDLVRQGEKKAYMILKFKLDEREYQVKTEINVYESKDGKPKVSTKKTVLQKKPDGKYVSLHRSASTTGAKNVIYEVLGRMDAKLFSNMIYSQQGEIEKIATSKNAERRDLFYNILNLNQYTQASDLARKIENIITREIANDKQRLDDLARRIEENKNIQQEVNKEQEKKGFLEKKIKQKTKEYERFKKEKDELEALSRKLSNLKGQHNTYKEQLTQEQQAKQNIEQNITKHLDTLNVKDQNMENVRTWVETEINTTRENRKNIDTRIHEIRNTKQRITELNQEIQAKASKQNKLIQNLKAIEQEVFKILQYTTPFNQEQLETLDKDLAKIEEQQASIEAKLSDIDRIHGEIDAKFKEQKKIERETQQTKKIIASLKKSITSKTGVTTIKELNDRIKTLNTEIENTTQHIIELTQKQSQAKTKQNALEKELKELKEKREILLKSKEPKCPVCGRPLSDEGKQELLDKWNKEEQEINENIKQLEKQQKDLKLKEKESQKKQQELQNTRKTLEKARGEIEKLGLMEKQLQELQAELKENQNEIKALQQQLLGLKPDELTQTRIALGEKEARLREGRDKLLKAMSIQEQVNTIREELEQKEKHLEQLQATIKGTNLEQLVKEEQDLQDKLDQLQELREQINKLTEAKTKIHDIEKRLQELKQQIARIESNYDPEKYKRVTQKFMQVVKEKESVETEYELLVKTILPEKERILEGFLRDKADYEEISRKIKAKQNALEATRFSKEILRSLPTKITRASLANISHRATEILQQLIPDRDIVGVKLNEDYSIDIERGGVYEKIARLSGGEKVIIALSLRIALIEEFSDLGIMLWDEPTAALDYDRINKLIDVLEYQRPIAQLIVVTHREEFRKIADQTILIQREPGWSKPVISDE